MIYNKITFDIVMLLLVFVFSLSIVYIGNLNEKEIKSHALGYVFYKGLNSIYSKLPEKLYNSLLFIGKVNFYIFAIIFFIGMFSIIFIN